MIVNIFRIIICMALLMGLSAIFGQGEAYVRISDQIGRLHGANRPPCRSKSATTG